MGNWAVTFLPGARTRLGSAFR
ncbi:uncharacterized protein CPUR_04958 [Claviceps purpurea 20.1]|uniref:Uncharacterized protein n=1 Tax=Claviceps purpurea (strain 20.1) TaxID=1111077 RepID=M1VWE0_CLAP2|nr:uncharacterized protein CPUR_04958 [Claviceps purpurea 20.1]